MNAVIRAMVRTGLHLGYEMMGVKDGFKGLLDSDFRPLSARALGGIIQ
jgi:6-phosphofructokinase 1